MRTGISPKKIVVIVILFCAALVIVGLILNRGDGQETGGQIYFEGESNAEEVGPTLTLDGQMILYGLGVRDDIDNRPISKEERAKLHALGEEAVEYFDRQGELRYDRSVDRNRPIKEDDGCLGDAI